MSNITLSEWGDGVGLQIPQTILKQMNLDAGDQVHFEFSQNKIIITKFTPTLEDLLQNYEQINKHVEFFKDSKGREVL